MRINSLKLSLVITASLLALAACDKKADTTAATPAPAAATVPPATAPVAATTPTTPPAPAEAGKFKAVKEACAADLRKFCAAADKPGRCLKQHEAELTPSCNAARAAFKAAHQAAKAE